MDFNCIFQYTYFTEHLSVAKKIYNCIKKEHLQVVFKYFA